MNRAFKPTAVAAALVLASATARAQSLTVSNLEPGFIADHTVSLATPNGLVGIGYSFNAGTTTVGAGPCGPLSIDLGPPVTKQQIFIRHADARGMVSVRLPVPPNLNGRQIFYQAVDIGTCTLTNVVDAVVGQGPGIADVQPLAGGVGEPVTVTGADFGTTISPIDICIGNPASGFLMRATRVTDTEIQADMSMIGENAIPGPVMAIVGQGLETMINSPLPGIQLPNATWIWRGGPLGPDIIATSPQDFTPTQPARSPYGLPWYAANWQYDSVNRELVLDVPEPREGYLFDFQFDVCYRNVSTQERWQIDVDIDAGRICDSISHSSFVSLLEIVLNCALFDHGVTEVEAFREPFTTRLRIRARPGFEVPNCAWGRVVLFPDPASLANYPGGIDDDFASPTEPVSPEASFSSWLGSPIRAFDDQSGNLRFGHTVSGIQAPNGIAGALLEIRMKAAIEATFNDTIALQFDGLSSFAWSHAIADLPEANGRWLVGDEAVFCLDLSALPSSGGPVDILGSLNGRLELDIFVSDDTAVDYVKLHVLEDCP